MFLLQNQGKLKITGDSVVFKNSTTGKLETVPSSKFDTLSWTRLANQPALRISLDDGTMYRFGKFNDHVSDFYCRCCETFLDL